MQLQLEHSYLLGICRRGGRGVSTPDGNRPSYLEAETVHQITDLFVKSSTFTHAESLRVDLAP